MFIELHLKSGKSPVIIGLHHVVKISAATDGGTAIELANGSSFLVSESYADVKRTLEPR